MKKLLLSLLAIFGLSSCLMTRTDVKEAETKKVIQDQVVHLQKNTADTSNRFQEYDSQFRELNGRVETLENRLDQENKQRDKAKKSDEDLISEHSKTLELLKEEILKIQAQISGLATQLASVNAQAEVKARADSGDNKDSKSPFDQGEELLVKKEWKKAILSYQKYRDTNPKGKKFPEATYKIGVCFQELGLSTEAKSFFEEVINKYPASDSARKAKVRMKKVK